MNTFKPDSDCHKMPIPDIVKMLDEEAKTSVTECHACEGDGYLPSNGFDEAKVCNVCEGSGNLD
jgi:DnaJ-class molecular chaperone